MRDNKVDRYNVKRKGALSAKSWSLRGVVPSKNVGRSVRRTLAISPWRSPACLGPLGVLTRRESVAVGRLVGGEDITAIQATTIDVCGVVLQLLVFRSTQSACALSCGYGL